jgi:hypothetical protein
VAGTDLQPSGLTDDHLRALSVHLVWTLKSIASNTNAKPPIAWRYPPYELQSNCSQIPVDSQSNSKRLMTIQCDRSLAFAWKNHIRCSRINRTKRRLAISCYEDASLCDDLVQKTVQGTLTLESLKGTVTQKFISIGKWKCIRTESTKRISVSDKERFMK